MADGLPTTIAGRYTVRSVLGAGAMAQVYEVVDESTGHVLALKRLSPDRKAHALHLQREYDTLTQLSHPLIIRVLDYGVDGGLPFYTMERLVGRTANELAPLPFRDAASLVRDVASALALVHSRRLVHRDVSARNVCRTEEGSAKLIDFGALSPMGPVREIVGTPPFLCPESLEQRPLDARADLFSLGALAYFLLTGRHAYPAHRISELGEVWKQPVPPPSALAPDVPAAFDALVLALIEMNPLARPASATEVYDRLTAIADLPRTELPETANAYFLTPGLVARGPAMRRFRRHLLRAERGQGGTLLVESPRGGGRSRLLASMAVEAKLRGGIVLSVDARRGQSSAFGVARSLAAALADAEPALAANAATSDPELGRILRLGPEAAEGPDRYVESETWVPAAELVARFLVDLSRRRPLFVGIDEIDASDGPSAAIVTALAEAAPAGALLVVATSVSGAHAASTERIRRAGSALVLAPFRTEETRELLSSVFGDVPYLEEVASWAHRLSEGLPRGLLELAQHLVDTGLARYAEGGWVLPSSFGGVALPASVDDALDARVRALGPAARRVAAVLALLRERSPLPVTSYPALFDPGDAAEIFLHLNELVSASVLVDDGTTYSFTSAAVQRAVRRTIAEGDASLIHRRVARAYESGGAASMGAVAHHLMLAGEPQEAFTRLAKELRDQSSSGERGTDLFRAPEAAATVEEIYEWGCAHDVDPVDLAAVSRGVLQLASSGDSRLARHGGAILERLRRDSGLDLWPGLAHIEDPALRIQACVAAAYERHMASDDRARRLDPGTAIQQLAVAAALLIGVAARGADNHGARAIEELISPLRPLSPALDVICDLVAVAARATRGHYTRDLRIKVADRTAAPVPGIDEVSRGGIHVLSLYYLVLEDTTLGNPIPDERLAPLEASAPYTPLALQIRMLREYYRGNEKGAEAYRRLRDAAMTGRVDVDGHLETSVIYEASAYAALGNLIALKRLVPVLEARSRVLPGWRPHHRYAAGNCHFMRGDYEKAIEEYEIGLGLEGIETHAGRTLLTSRLIVALTQAGRPAEAKARAEAALRRFGDEPLIPLYLDQLWLALAAAEAALGESAPALARSRAALARTEARGVSGVALANLLTECALVAQRAGDDDGFETLTRRVGDIAARAESTALAKQHARLLAMRRSAYFETALPSIDRYAPGNAYTELGKGVRTELEQCRGEAERTRRALEILLKHTAASGGFLYVCRGDRLECVAQAPETEPPPELDARVSHWASAAFGTTGDVTATASLDELPGAALTSRFGFVELVCAAGGQLSLVGVAALVPSQARLASVPRELLAAVADQLVESGDATSRRIANT